MRQSTAESLDQAYGEGWTKGEIRKRLGVAYRTIAEYEQATGRRFRRDRRGAKPRQGLTERELKVAALYRGGLTLQQIGGQLGLTRERIRQLLKRAGVSAQEGGQSRVAAERKAAALRKREARCLLKYGCTLGQLAGVRQAWPLATKRFVQQRTNAGKRGIGWELSFWQWWTVWQQSGLWEQRGRGDGYVMCRVGDEGAYALGNVFIATAVENTSKRKGRKYDLPLGVTKERNRYAAHRTIAGKIRRLGTFATPEEAHAAYLAARLQPKRSEHGASPASAERRAGAGQ